MGIFTIMAVFLIAACVAVKCRESFYDTFPMTVSGMILVLYCLAFFRVLPFIDWIGVGSLAVMAFCFWREFKNNGNTPKQIAGVVFSAESITLFCFLILITFLVRDKAAVWWDDINYWAVDAKALYFNNGFAGKYGNVAPEFGDYPPAIQLFKWFFLHFSPEFKEGLMFGAYYCLNIIYAMPLLAKLKTRNPLAVILGLVGIFLLPGIVDGMAVEGTCADVTMGLVYGAFLWAAYDREGHGEKFYFIRMSLYLCILVLTKSVGIEWAFFGIVFFILIYTKHLKESGQKVAGRMKPIVLMCLSVLAVEGSWLLFCLINRRVAKLTGAGVKMALSGDFTLPDNTMIKMGHFLRGFAFYPMHLDRTWGIDMSSLALLILILAVTVVFYKTGILKKWECKRFLVFILLTALAAYGIIFLGHLTIFAGELQYLDDAIMAKSIARYGAPFSVGLIYLLMQTLIQKKKTTVAYAICLAFVLATTSLPGAYETLHGYRQTLEENITGRGEMIEANAQIFLDKAAGIKAETTDKELFEKRVLYLRDDHTIHWIKDTYISYEASPIPVVYGGIATDTMTQEDMVRRIRESHAKYLYADTVEGNPDALFADMLGGESFEYEMFYEIIDTDGVMRLVKIQ